MELSEMTEHMTEHMTEQSESPTCNKCSGWGYTVDNNGRTQIGFTFYGDKVFNVGDILNYCNKVRVNFNIYCNKVRVNLVLKLALHIK